MGLQPSGLGDKENKNKEIINECRSADERTLELVVLKNRAGRIGTVFMRYKTPYNDYLDVGEVNKSGVIIRREAETVPSGDSKVGSGEMVDGAWGKPNWVKQS